MCGLDWTGENVQALQQGQRVAWAEKAVQPYSVLDVPQWFHEEGYYFWGYIATAFYQTRVKQGRARWICEGDIWVSREFDFRSEGKGKDDKGNEVHLDYEEYLERMNRMALDSYRLNKKSKEQVSKGSTVLPGRSTMTNY